MSAERALSRMSLTELYSLLLDRLSRLDTEGGREEAARIVRAMVQAASRLKPSISGAHPRVQQAILTGFAERLSKVQEALAALHVLLESGSARAVRKAAVSLGAQIGALVVFTEMPTTAPLAGLTEPADVTDVASEVGGVAARVYGYILRCGRVSSRVLARWAAASGIDRGDLEEALRRLVERGYVRVEAGGEGLEYLPV
ncbi:MAG: hypothetical protein QW324_04860 [Thermofilaceae archaeon]